MAEEDVIFRAGATTERYILVTFLMCRYIFPSLQLSRCERSNRCNDTVVFADNNRRGDTHRSEDKILHGATRKDRPLGTESATP